MGNGGIPGKDPRSHFFPGMRFRQETRVHVDAITTSPNRVEKTHFRRHISRLREELQQCGVQIDHLPADLSRFKDPDLFQLFQVL